MHELLELKGKLEKKKRLGFSGINKLPSNSILEATKIEKLISDILKLRDYWVKELDFNGALVTVYYNKIMAKSNRINLLFEESSDTRPTNEKIVGAKFVNNCHVITYLLGKNSFDEILSKLYLVKNILNFKFDGQIDSKTLEEVSFGNIDISNYAKKTYFTNLLVEMFYIDKFVVEINEKERISEIMLVTCYDVGTNLSTILKKSNIEIYETKRIDNTTFLLTRKQYERLIKVAPYLVAMVLDDINKLYINNLGEVDTEKIVNIPSPSNEPTIGLIDTLFCKDVYFKNWVQEHNDYIDSDLVSRDDYDHATEIASILVNGHVTNPKLNDGCGYFKVRHFGIATEKETSSFSIIKLVKQIVEENPDIRVWNLSLGSKREIEKNFISFEGAILDKLQSERDIIFVVSGTNKSSDINSIKIGAPADSINSIVVNSVDFNGEPAEYSRSGPVLSFFNKPDICYYGGTVKNPIRVCNGQGQAFKMGTSYAAPWISRKLAYLMEVLRIPREIAKALIIDSATSWDKVNDNPTIMGYGVVPIKIDDIIKTRRDEIKFFIQGVAEKYDTYTYSIPVPITKEKQPFISKATMCYFPKCSRNQGVDYTNIELDLHFGRIKETKHGLEIKCINDNKQGIPNIYGGNEEQARSEYRKWDNVKHICEKSKNRKIAKEVFTNGLWGLSIKKVSRLTSNNDDKIPFGVVVTLKDIFGDDHYEEFIQQCNFRGLIVNRIITKERIELYNTIEEDIVLD